MAGEPMNQAKRALQEFVRGLDPVDQAAIIAFDAQVTLVQDFTSDRALLDQAIGRLAPLGDTALYSGVLEALAKASAAPGSRRLIVLLSDGQATTGLALRSDSIDAARNGGIGIVAVGLGSGIDGAYLNELTAASGGRFLEAPTPASLREAYADLAVAIRSQYTLVLQVPSGIDRSVPAELLVQASLRADSGKAVREIPPLAGALPPPFLVSLLGITAGQRTEERLSVTPKTPPGVSLVGVEYFLDNDLVVRTTQPPFAYELDPTAIAEGPHILKVVATDARGRLGETQLSFIAALAVPASEPARPEPQTLLVMAGGVVVLGGIIYVFFRRLRSRSKNAVASRVRPWAVRTAEPLPPVEGWPSPPPPPPDADRFLGRVIVMDEAAVQRGELDAIREYPVGMVPLALGCVPASDVRLEDAEGRIAAEEARLWVQRGCLVYHKLTTLSAMATEGVTSGWQILESDEEIVLGPYRILFRADPPTERAEPDAASAKPTDEVVFLRELWPRLPEDPPLGASSTE